MNNKKYNEEAEEYDDDYDEPIQEDDDDYEIENYNEEEE